MWVEASVSQGQYENKFSNLESDYPQNLTVSLSKAKFREISSEAFWVILLAEKLLQANK